MNRNLDHAPRASFRRLLIASLVFSFACGSPSTAQKVDNVVQTGQANGLQAAVFSPDGKMLASTYGKSVKIWDLATGKELKTLNGHTDLVTALAFSRDGKSLASGSWDYSVKVWDIGSAKIVRSFTGHSDLVAAVAFSPDSKTLASGSWDKSAKLWDLSSGKELKSLGGKDSGLVNALAFSPDSKVLACGSKFGITLWNLASGKMLKSFSDGPGLINAISFDRSGKHLASGSTDSAALWDPAKGTHTRSLGAYAGSTVTIGFGPNAKTIVTAVDDNTIKLWDSSSGKCLQTLKTKKGTIESVAFSNDGKKLLGSVQNSVSPWGALSEKDLEEQDANWNKEWKLVFDGTAHKNLSKVAPLSKEEERKFKLLVVPEAKKKFWNGDEPSGFKVVDIAKGSFTLKGVEQKLYLYTYFDSGPASSNGIAIIQDGKLVAHAAYKGSQAGSISCLPDLNGDGLNDLAIETWSMHQGFRHAGISLIGFQNNKLKSFGYFPFEDDNVSSGQPKQYIFAYKIFVKAAAKPRFEQAQYSCVKSKWHAISSPNIVCPSEDYAEYISP